MTIHDLINLGIKKLSKTSPSAALDAEVLLSHVLGKRKEYLLLNPKKKIDPKLEKKFLTMINRRLLGWPVAYLIKSKEFYGLNFNVDKKVLIPRPETEGLVEMVVKTTRKSSHKKLNIVDIGTGSGNIIIALAKQIRPLYPVPRTLFFASDISPKAIQVARKNAKLHKVKITFGDGNLLEPWTKHNFDIIIANLPYLAKLVDDSTKFEPLGALVAAKKGLKLYEELFRQIVRRKNQPNYIFLEIGRDQGHLIKKLSLKLLPKYRVKVFKDLSSRNRYAVLTKNPPI